MRLRFAQIDLVRTELECLARKLNIELEYLKNIAELACPDCGAAEPEILVGMTERVGASIDACIRKVTYWAPAIPDAVPSLRAAIATLDDELRVEARSLAAAKPELQQLAHSEFEMSCPTCGGKSPRRFDQICNRIIASVERAIAKILNAAPCELARRSLIRSN
jgi:Zn finger protein HypA/HybF involved in hydrogenase expression